MLLGIFDSSGEIMTNCLIVEQYKNPYCLLVVYISQTGKRGLLYWTPETEVRKTINEFDLRVINRSGKCLSF